MFTKPERPKSLIILEALRKRMNLSVTHRDMYRRLGNGYAGEELIYQMLKERGALSYLSLYGLNLKIDGSECQIDAILLFQNDLYLLEMKHYQGDYFFKNNSLYTVSTNREISNPLHQLQRTELLLQEFLTKHDAHFNIRSFIVFTHPDFHMYQAPLKTPIIFPGQLNRFLASLQSVPHQLDARHQKTADALRAAHLHRSAYEQLPKYDDAALRKGVTCAECDGMMKVLAGTRRFVCGKCTREENVDCAIVRNVADFTILCPDSPITISSIYTWCGEIVSRKSIRRILQKHGQPVSNGKYTYYLFNKDTI